jgi:hypothetical protein
MPRTRGDLPAARALKKALRTRRDGSRRRHQKERIMSARKIVLFVVLADFVAIAAWATSRVGVVGLFTGMVDSPASIVASTDLLISLGLVCTWLVRDARARGVSPLPYLLLTPLLGSASPLLYLLRRPDAARESAPSRVAVHAG